MPSPRPALASSLAALLLGTSAALAQQGPPPGSEGGMPPGFAEARQYADDLADDPFTGLTTDGTMIEGLYPLETTGVSTAAMRETASALIAALTEAQREAALFPVDDVEWRLWSNVDDYERAGVSLAEMDDSQKALAFAMLAAFLSDQGLTEVENAMQLNTTLGELTGELDRFNSELYWFTFMGTPSEDQPWGFQLDGHHIAINFFVLGDQLSITPAFLGAEPTIAPEGTTDAGLAILQEKQNKGLAFAQSLDEAQRAQAVISTEKVSDDMLASAFSDNLEMPYAGCAPPS